MIIGTRVMNLTIDEGGVPPHIKPLIASIVSAIGQGNWGEVTHSTCTVQELEELEEAYEASAEALEASEEEVHEVRQAARNLVEKIGKFCNSAEVVAVSRVLEEVYEAGSESLELLEQIEEVETSFVIAVEELKTYALRKQTEL